MLIPSPRALLIALVLVAPAAFLGVHALGPNPLAGYPEGSVVMPDGAVAIPMRADPPAAYTPEVHAKVLAAAEKGMGYDIDNDREVALATNFLFIRPGAWMWSPSWCTMAFVFGTPGNYKISTAGHCASGTQDVSIVAGHPGIIVNIGKVSSFENTGPGHDWALVTIRTNMQQYVDPNVADIQGPMGEHPGSFALTTGPIGSKHIGHGLVIGTTGTPRVGTAMGAVGSTVYFHGVIAPGDSGSPLLTIGNATYPTGQALAIITHLAPAGLYTGIGTLVSYIPSATVANGDIVPTPP